LPHAKPSTWRTGVSLFVWVITLDLSGMGGPTSSICYRQHGCQDHVTTQTPPLHQQCSQTQSKVYPKCHRPSVTPTSIKILHKHTHIYISTNMLSENRKENKTFCSCGKYYFKLISLHFLDSAIFIPKF
jgi:hypothetical protein